MPRRIAGRKIGRRGKRGPIVGFSRRERQIMDVVYRLGRASAAQVRRQLPDPPSYSAVRTLLTILERKGQLKHVLHGPRYVYLLTQSRHTVGRAALRQLLDTFFEGSLAKAVTAHLSDLDAKVTEEELEQLTVLIREAKRERR